MSPTVVFLILPPQYKVQIPISIAQTETCHLIRLHLREHTLNQEMSLTTQQIRRGMNIQIIEAIQTHRSELVIAPLVMWECPIRMHQLSFLVYFMGEIILIN
jgi:hypothetical protein